MTIISNDLLLVNSNAKLVKEINDEKRIYRTYDYKVRLIRDNYFFHTIIRADFKILKTVKQLVEEVEFITPEELTPGETKDILLYISEEYQNY